MSISKPKLWKEHPPAQEAAQLREVFPGLLPSPETQDREGPGAGQHPASGTPAQHCHRTPAAVVPWGTRVAIGTGLPGRVAALPVQCFQLGA